jgi:MoaA/NifB/PqqE/SkfB family radical SAM enzyme
MTDMMEKVDHKPPPPIRGFWYYLRCLSRRMPRLMNLEITKRCNARCGFCSCWQVESEGELEDYAPVIKKFKPVVVSVSGGEPLVRKNYAEILKNIRPHCHYLGLITNGALLNDKSAQKLMDAGVNHISVSLDYLGPRHDEMRCIPGLYDHLLKTIPQLAAKGYRLVLNTVIMESNLDQVLPIAYMAKEWGVTVSYSAYCPLKKDDEDQMVRIKRYTQLVQVVDEIKKLKRQLGNIKNSDYYLDGIAPYFRDGGRPKCKAGFNWVQVTPDGYIQQCSELPRVFHYSEYSQKKLKRPSCTKCWYTCRGEAEAHPLKPSRLVELIRA